jgi:hypothetical protein
MNDLSKLALGVGVGGTGVGAKFGAAVGTSSVGGGGALGVPMPVKINTVPSTILSATIAFSPTFAYQRQSRLFLRGSTRLGISDYPPKIAERIIPHSPRLTNRALDELSALFYNRRQ